MTIQDLDNLLAVNPEDHIDRVNGMPPSRHMSSIERGHIVRAYFKQWKVRGMKVRKSPRNIVNIYFTPISDADHDKSKWPHRHTSECCRGVGGGPDCHTDATRCPLCKKLCQARDHLAMCLDVIFPDHVDRSDSQTDYFDYCWSIQHGS